MLKNHNEMYVLIRDLHIFFKYGPAHLDSFFDIHKNWLETILTSASFSTSKVVEIYLEAHQTYYSQLMAFKSKYLLWRIG